MLLKVTRNSLKITQFLMKLHSKLHSEIASSNQSGQLGYIGFIRSSFLFLFRIGVNLLHDRASWLPSAKLLDIIVGHDLAGRTCEEVPELVKGEVRKAEALLQSGQIHVDAVRMAVIDIALRSDQIDHIVRYADGADGLARLRCVYLYVVN